MENADIENADIENADIENADIENADIENEDFIEYNYKFKSCENQIFRNKIHFVKCGKFNTQFYLNLILTIDKCSMLIPDCFTDFYILEFKKYNFIDKYLSFLEHNEQCNKHKYITISPLTNELIDIDIYDKTIYHNKYINIRNHIDIALKLAGRYNCSKILKPGIKEYYFKSIITKDYFLKLKQKLEEKEIDYLNKYNYSKNILDNFLNDYHNDLSNMEEDEQKSIIEYRNKIRKEVNVFFCCYKTIQHLNKYIYELKNSILDLSQNEFNIYYQNIFKKQYYK